MNLRHAKELARHWVLEEAARSPRLYGAFYHGSVNWLPDDADLPGASDLDVMLVFDGPDLPDRPGKFRHEGVLLEISCLPLDRLSSTEAVLADYHLAGSFHVPSVIWDPSGALTRLQAEVAAGYARRRWVRRRCEHARSGVLRNLDGVSGAGAFHERVMAWLFAAGVTTHVLLAAGLKNPTVRKRYLAARELLSEYGLAECYEPLLELLGCARMTRLKAERHLAALSNAFDTAAAVLRTPYRFAADLTPEARPVAIDGSRELIERGDHREAVFWMVATYSRCSWVLDHDAPPAVREDAAAGYRRLLADLGITSAADLPRRAEDVRRFLPRVWEVAERITAANPEILPDA